MREKRAVYNGYEERYVIGSELKEMFAEQYLTTGRHHASVLGITIPEYLAFLNIDDTLTYRIFVNQHFCKVMKNETDGEITFFGYNTLDKTKLSMNPSSLRLERECPDCGASMELKDGKYGKFLGCSGYPSCKHTMKIPVIGNILDLRNI